MPLLRRSRPLGAAVAFLLLGLLWFRAADLAVLHLLGPEARPAVGAAARWGFVGLGALAVYLAASRSGRDPGEPSSRPEKPREIYERAVRSMDDSLFVVDVETRSIVSCNPAAEEMFGYDRREIVGASTRLLHVDDEHWREFARRSDPVVAQGRTWRGEFRMQRKDGTEFRTEHAVSLLEGNGDGRVRAVSVVRDVTERERRAEAVRRRARRLRAILANIPDVIAVVDDEAEIRYASPSIRHALGWNPEEVVGRSGFELVHPEDRERVEGVFREILPTGEGSVRYRCRRGDDGWSPVESRAVVTEDASLAGRVVVSRVLPGPEREDS